MAEMRSVSTLRNLLAQSLEQTGLLKNAKSLVFVDRKDSVKKSFDVISHEHVLSAPVWDSEKSRWAGIVDVRDYLHFVLGRHGQQRSQEDGDLTVDHIMNLSKRNPLVPVPPTAPVAALIKMFDRGLHRALVGHSLNSQDVHMMSQSSIIKWLNTNKDQLGDWVHKTLDDLGVGMKHVFTVSRKETAYNAFRLLRDHNIHGLAVVDEDRKIWGNISVTDLKYAADNMERLSLPLTEFFQKRQEPLVCTPQTKLIDAIGQLDAAQVHRLHVVDSQRIPIGVVALSDIMDIMLVLSGEHEGLQD